MANKPILIPDGVGFGDETLSKYDEGTWTPSTNGTPTNLTGTANYGTAATYTRIGNTVFARIEVITGLSITTAGNYTYLAINPTGLPGVVNGTQYMGSATSVVNVSPYEILPCIIADQAPGDTLIFLQISSQANIGVVNLDPIAIYGVYFQYKI